MTQLNTITFQQLAGLKASHTRLTRSLKGTRGSDRAGLKARIAEVEAKIANATVDESSRSLQTVAALTAHVTRRVVRLKRARGKARAELQSKIESLETKIAEAA